MAIRSGLARLEGVESINPRADFKAATCEVHWKNGQFIDPQTLSNHVYQLSLGARLRGLEATVEGWLKKEGSDVVLQIRGTNVVLRLAPLRVKVQRDVARKAPSALTPAEATAYENLLARWKGDPRLVRVTGPVVKNDRGPGFALEVRQFDLAP